MTEPILKRSDKKQEEIHRKMFKLEEIWKLQHELNCKIGLDTINNPNKKDWLYQLNVALHDESQELQNSCHWKWWSKEVKENPDLMYKIKDEGNAKIEAIDILHFLISIFQVLDMSPDDVMEVYRMKHGKNVDRQNNGYDIETKNEGDNEDIIRRIS